MGIKLSIVTVCYNAEKTIGNTIESILNQTFNDYEYILIDGKSEDKTNEIIDSYKKLFVSKKVAFRHYSEKDNGIYDAMNKGAILANGEWISFMNADDTYYDQNTLKRVFELDINTADCVCGDTVSVLNGDKFYRKALPIETISYRNPLVHQSMICKTALIKLFLFDTQYRYAADFDLVCRMYKKGHFFKYIEMPVAIFGLTGVSQKNSCAAVMEFEKIRKANGMAWHNIIKRYLIYFAVIIIKGNPRIYSFYVRLRGIMKHEGDTSKSCLL